MKNILLLVALSVFSSSSYSAIFSPQAVMRVVKTSTGATVSTKYAGMTAANQAVYAIRAVNVPKASIVAASKVRMFSPWGIAMTAAIIAAGYVVDEINETIASPPPPAFNGIGTCYSYPFNFSVTNISVSDCLALFKSHDSTMEYGPLNGRYYSVSYLGTSPYPAGHFEITDGSTPPQNVPPQPAPQPITDTEYYDWLKQSPYYDPTFESPLSGQPNPDIVEFDNVATDVTNDYAAANDNDPLTIPTVDLASGDTGVEEITETEPEDVDPCVKNPSLISCMETGEMQNSVDIVTQDVSFSINAYSLSSNATCPADIPLPKGMSYSFQPVCTVASSLNPVINAAAFLSALLIVSGAGRREV